MSTAWWLSVNSSARVASPTARMALWAHAGRQRPTRMQASSTIQTFSFSTATASEGQTRTHARHATHSSGSILKSTRDSGRALETLDWEIKAGLIYRVFFEFAIEGAFSNAEVLGSLAAIPVRLTQRGIDRRALDVGHGHAGFVDHWLLGLRCRVERVDGPKAVPGVRCLVSDFNNLHALRWPLLDAPAEVLHLHLELHQRAEDELQLLTGHLGSGRLDAHRQGARALADVARDVAGANLPLGCEHDHRLDEVPELAHVAGPVGVDEDLQRVGRNAVEFAVVH